MTTLPETAMPCCPGFLSRRAILMAGGLLLALALPAAALAHAVRHEVRHATATVITLKYDDGQALANAVFEAAPVEAAQVAVTGLTDAAGRAVIVTDAPGRWRLRVFSTDGHGAVVEFEAPASTLAAAPAGAGISRWVPGLAGLLMLACIFAAVQCWLRRRGRSA